MTGPAKETVSFVSPRPSVFPEAKTQNNLKMEQTEKIYLPDGAGSVCRRLKMHELITCESNVQVGVSLGSE